MMISQKKQKLKLQTKKNISSARTIGSLVPGNFLTRPGFKPSNADLSGSATATVLTYPVVPSAACDKEVWLEFRSCGFNI